LIPHPKHSLLQVPLSIAAHPLESWVCRRQPGSAGIRPGSRGRVDTALSSAGSTSTSIPTDTHMHAHAHTYTHGGHIYPAAILSSNFVSKRKGEGFIGGTERNRSQ